MLLHDCCNRFAVLLHDCCSMGCLTVPNVQVCVQHAAVLAVWHHSGKARPLRVLPAQSSEAHAAACICTRHPWPKTLLTTLFSFPNTPSQAHCKHLQAPKAAVARASWPLIAYCTNYFCLCTQQDMVLHKQHPGENIADNIAMGLATGSACLRAWSAGSTMLEALMPARTC